MREWIDIEMGEYDPNSFEVSKKMIRLLRHDPSVLREEDGAVEFKIMEPMFAFKIRVFSKAELFAKRKWSQERFQYCLIFTSAEQFKAIGKKTH